MLWVLQTFFETTVLQISNAGPEEYFHWCSEEFYTLQTNQLSDL
uniref:Uncharacterized protein n=1 Tax=Setaria italica TaxID=4555 RepID=K3XTU1_SETIT